MNCDEKPLIFPLTPLQDAVVATIPTRITTYIRSIHRWQFNARIKKLKDHLPYMNKDQFIIFPLTTFFSPHIYQNPFFFVHFILHSMYPHLYGVNTGGRTIGRKKKDNNAWIKKLKHHLHL